MLFQAIFYLFVLIIAIYYSTIVIQMLGFPILAKKLEINVGLAFIPFYYWFSSGKKEKSKDTKSSLYDTEANQEFLFDEGLDSIDEDLDDDIRI